jgi:hypothetical protein
MLNTGLQIKKKAIPSHASTPIILHERECKNMAKPFPPDSRVQKSPRPRAKREDVSLDEIRSAMAKIPAAERGISRGNTDMPRKFRGKNKLPAELKMKAKPRGASRKGIPNTVTKQLKEMILGALDKRGGEEYLATQAIINPGPFMALLGKILPTQIASDPENPLQVQLVSTAEALLAKIRGGGEVV